jgi:hypothetical protein
MRADILDGVDLAVDVAEQHFDAVDLDALGGSARNLAELGDGVGHAGSFAKAPE